MNTLERNTPMVLRLVQDMLNNTCPHSANDVGDVRVANFVIDLHCMTLVVRAWRPRGDSDDKAWRVVNWRVVHDLSDLDGKVSP